MNTDPRFVLQPGELMIYYELEDGERSSSRGIVEVCPETHRSGWFYRDASIDSDSAFNPFLSEPG